MQPRVILAATLITAMLAFITSSYSSGDDHPEGTLVDPTTGAPSPHPKPKPTGTLSDLRVEHVWLDDQCRINFKLKNFGESTIPDRVHNQGMVRVYFGEEYEDFYFRKTSSQKKLPVDPRKALKSPGSTLTYNTKIEVKEKLSVSVHVGYSNRIAMADNQQRMSLTLTPTCWIGEGFEPTPKPTGVLCDGKLPTIMGDNGDNILNGTPGDDVIQGLGGNDTIDGKGGNDIICGGPGNDIIQGGPSTSTSTFVNCSGPWSGDHDRLYGGPGNDTLDGGPGTDCVFGEAGNDRLNGVEGLDTLDGGGGDDTYFFTNSSFGSAKVIEAPNADTDTFDFSQFPAQNGIAVSLNYLNTQVVSSGQSGLSLTLSSDTGIENLIGTPHKDILRGNSRDNLIMGGDGGDSNSWGGCGNQSETLAGREGNDTLMGQGGSDELSGDEGDDILDGGPGIDCLQGGPGEDTLSGGQGDDWLWAGPGQDQLTGGQGDDWLQGGPDDDHYFFVGSNLGTDTVSEEPNVDTDTLDFSQFTEGQICVDLNLTSPYYCQGQSTKLAMTNKDGVENVIGSDFDDHIEGNNRDNVFDGGSGDDFLYGRYGNDTLKGGDDNDHLRGGPDDDQLFGDSGNDSLIGDDVATQAYSITWTSGVNVQINGSTLTKNSGGTAWNAGAVSVETLAAGDGFVSTTVAETNTHRMIGLSNGNSGVHYNDIDFAAYLKNNGTLAVYENGILIANGPFYQSGDEIAVEVSEGTVYYKRNGTTFYTSSNSPNYPLLVDTSLYNLNATLSVSIGGGFISTGNDTCDGGAGQDTAGTSCESKINIEINSPNP